MDPSSIYKDLGVLPMWYQVSDSTGSLGVKVFGADTREIPELGEE